MTVGLREAGRGSLLAWVLQGAVVTAAAAQPNGPAELEPAPGPAPAAAPATAREPGPPSTSAEPASATPTSSTTRPSEPTSPAPSDELQPIDDDEKREVPDYDGRGDEPTDAGDVLIWVPRILLSPVYLASEYVVRWPLGQIVTAAEKNDLPALIVDFFTFGPEKKAGIVPTALIDFGLRSSVGLYLFWDDYLADGHDFRLRAATGGAHWFLLNATHRSWLDEAEEDSHIDARFEYGRRPDWLYYGAGPRAPERLESVYEAQRIEGGWSYYSRLWRSSKVDAYLALRDVRFFDGGCCPPDDVRLGTRIAEGSLAAPAGWADGYTVALQRVQASLDTRKLRDSHEGDGSDFVSPPGTGLRLALRGQLAEGLRPTASRADRDPSRPVWVSYGGTLGAFLDLDQRQRVVGLSAIVDFADPLLSGGEIPFTELVTLGGDRPLRGFLPGRLVGRSSVAWRLEYRWPVWVWLDGTVHYSVGNVFDEHLDDFHGKLLRQSFGLGLRTISARDHTFEALVACGTETFDEGANVETVRFVLGTSSGF